MYRPILLFFLSLCLFPLWMSSQRLETVGAASLHLLPQPQYVERGSEATLEAAGLKGVVAPRGLISDARIAAALAGSGIPATSRTGRQRKERAIRLSIDTLLAPEGYDLSIGRDGVRIAAHTTSGAYYGLTTLAQLSMLHAGRLPECHISDAPRFRYRGVMIDVSRHFRSIAFLKKQINLLSRVKINHLHLHLTDAAGWRLEIRRYPALTQKAAWRPQALWKNWQAAGGPYCLSTDSAAYGGYYTQEEMRNLVAYAAQRGVTIVPEIEMPSHSEEVTTLYPQLSCRGVAHRPDLCVGREATFRFLENVLEEVMDIFPSHYIHVGGDEASKEDWKDCDSCRRRMAEEQLQDVDALQSYLIRRIEKYLRAHGRALLGWDEILQGGLAPQATVMSWRGEQGGRQAAALGHDAIMTPGEYCYLDSYQDAPNSQPEAFGGYLPLEKVYRYEPVSPTMTEAEQAHIIGVQGNLWSEYIPTDAHAEYMLYPRALALAEVGWTQPTQRSWPHFRERIGVWQPLLKAQGYQCFDYLHEVGNRPESLSPLAHLAVGKKVTFLRPYWRNYPAAGEATLTDGWRGGWNYNDRRWLGFVGRPRMDVVIDLEDTLSLHHIGADFMQICEPGVYLPAVVTISLSDDGVHFVPLTTCRHTVVKDDAVTFKHYGWEGCARGRYVRYQADADTLLGGVLFVDEIVVE
jgi:hexosaminidase